MFPKIILSIGKIFLEQSSELTSKYFINNPLKILAGVMLFCVFILCNTYKNDNMYEMMLPKVFIPVENYEQLLRFNYNIYSLPSVNGINNKVRDIDFNKSSEMKIISQGKHYALIKVGRKSLMDFFSQVFMDNYDVGSIRPKYFETVLKSSEIWMQALENNKRDAVETVLSRKQDLVRENINSLMYPNMDTEIAVLTELELCKNVAFIETDIKIYEWEMILRHKGVKKLTVEKDILIKTSFKYRFRQWMPMFIYKRMEGVKASGILEWWDKIFSRHLSKIRLTLKLQNLSNKKLSEYYNKKVSSTNEYNSRAFFLVFYLVLEVGFSAVICCVFEFVCYFRRAMFQQFIKKYSKYNTPFHICH